MGIRIGGVVFNGLTEDGAFMNVQIPVNGPAMKLTSGGNKLLAYAKVPEGNCTMQITAWLDGDAQDIEAAKVQKKVAARKIELVKGPRA